MPRRIRRTNSDTVGTVLFTTLNRFRTGVALVLGLSPNSFVWQFALLCLLLIGLPSTTDRLIDLR